MIIVSVSEHVVQYNTRKNQENCQYHCQRDPADTAAAQTACQINHRFGRNDGRDDHLRRAEMFPQHRAASLGMLCHKIVDLLEQGLADISAAALQQRNLLADLSFVALDLAL